jgi:hypothetical protein
MSWSCQQLSHDPSDAKPVGSVTVLTELSRLLSCSLLGSVQTFTLQQRNSATSPPEVMLDPRFKSGQAGRILTKRLPVLIQQLFATPS